jgi:hypothetical protein
LRSAICANPGKLPVIIELHYGNESVVDIDLGDTYRVGAGVSFLSELAKIIPQNDYTFAPSDKIYLAPPERKPWES